MAKWFYQTNGQKSGPVDPAELKRLATTGHLKPTDKVRREDLADWYEAKKIKGLFPLPGSQVAPSPVEGKPTKSEAKPGAVWWPLPDDISKEPVDSNFGPTPATQKWNEVATENWYYIDDGQELGPLDVSDLKRLVEEGQLKQHDKVRRADGTNWNTIEQLADLFAACQSEPTKRRASPKPNRAALYGCGCLLAPLILSALITVIVVTTSPSVDPGIRERLEALNREARREGGWGILSSFEATPPPIEDAVAAGKEVWLLNNCPLMQESLQDSLYVVMDGNRVDKIIVKSRVSKLLAKVTYHLDGESIIWNESELKTTADPNSDFAI